MLLLAALGIGSAEAARIGDVVDLNAGDMAKRFFHALFDWGPNRDRSTETIRIAVPGVILLGINCGLLGSFVVVRKVALIGDMLAHAVLPGVAIGFLFKMEKDPVVIVGCAVFVGMVATLLMQAILRTTRLKQDTALALVLGSFYAVGVCLMKRIESLPTASKSGLESFWFGSASALSEKDVLVMLITTAATLVMLFLFYKTLLASSFDRDFTVSVGLPVRWIDRLFMLMTTFAIVVAMQAVGVVLVSAMLVIPAATAYLLAERMTSMLWLSALFGALSAVIGVFVAFLDASLPTGPFFVLAAALLFTIAFLFGRRHGLVTKKFRARSRKERIESENTLKAMYRVLEDTGFTTDEVALDKLADRRRESVQVARSRVQALVKSGVATLDGAVAYFTPEGYTTACRVVRNHRLWELYLTQIADYEPDHVHDDAEEIEHVLGDETVRKLERALAFPNKDPHGQPIPSIQDLTTIPPVGPGPDSREQHGYG